jgi:hypothetical protein
MEIRCEIGEAVTRLERECPAHAGHRGEQQGTSPPP